MHVKFYSYRYAQEILEHPKYRRAWDEIVQILEEAPIFVYPGKSPYNRKLDVVQQVMNAYFDCRFALTFGWDYHPAATGIQDSNLAADFRKSFGDLAIQVEVQFGNMARWYSDIFKFQAAYSQNLIQMGLCVIPTYNLAVRIDSNVVNFERTVRELPAAVLSITLPILLAGIEPDEHTPVVDLAVTQFKSKAEVVRQDNVWRIVNGYLRGVPLEQIGPGSDIGPTCSTEPS